MFLKRTLLLFLTFLIVTFTHAQESWSPEVSQLYLQARDYLASNQLQQAIVTYRQAIQLAPDKMIFYRDLAKAYYSAHLYEDAEQTLAPLLKRKIADDQCYQVLAMCQAAGGNNKKSKHTLEEGIDRFPASGLLYHDLGKWYEDANEPEKALTQWLTGIQQDPLYHLNYYEAAEIYSHTDHPVWVILYGEIFVNMEQETSRSYDTRKMIVEAYKKLYSSILTEEIPRFGAATGKAGNFEEAVKDIYRKLSPEIKDGINIESLTRLRTLFVSNWIETYATKYPYSLFRYQEDLIQGDYFTLYNQWLLGKTLNEARFNGWKEENNGALEALGYWCKGHPLQPAKWDFYGDKDTKGLSPTRKE